MCWMPRGQSTTTEWKERSRRFHGLQARTPQKAVPTSGHPDLILHRGLIRTMDPFKPVAEALAVKGNRIFAVGSSDDVLALAGPQTRTLDLAGRMAMPGLNDSHLHQFRASIDGPKVALDGARSIGDVIGLVAERVARTPAGEWVEGRTLWHESLLAEERLPTRAELDPVSADHPVYLPRGGHVATVNSRALERAEITRDTPDPDGGTIVRDATGEPTGVLLERARDLLAAVLPAETGAAERQQMLSSQMAEMNRLGITSITDPGLLPDELDSYLDLYEAGDATVRSHLLLRVHNLDDLMAGVRALSPRVGNHFLRFDGFKYSMDGGVEGAALADPYQLVEGEQRDPDYRGEIILPRGGHEELAAMYLEAARAGFQFQTHAVGDVAAEVAMDHYLATNEQVPLAALRWVLVHLSMPTPRVLEEMARCEILSTMQDNAVLLGRNMLRWWGAQRAEAGNPIRTVLDAGIVVGGGTDGPVVPASPFISIWWMVTRGMLQGGTLGEQHAITGEEALALYTTGSARTQYVEDEVGTLKIGQLADIAVLDCDAATMPPDRITDLRCDLTMLDGKIVFER